MPFAHPDLFEDVIGVVVEEVMMAGYLTGGRPVAKSPETSGGPFLVVSALSVLDGRVLFHS
ncbi:hypothetical protein [Gordonia hongkongensis]|uniref:Uncharacterized protein n=1 Tax=Gordonia hongkongensis TaxID=1701090 RepID=A0ABT6BXC5_9ACTN|nr:hypothetical protein [Gordonia hongkongensis]MDF6102476.1 hypothetical protein [Gordonia hongkongensis]